MKTLIFASTLMALFSCSGYYHIKQAKKHAHKAEQKGVTPERDTTFVTSSDTTIQIDTLDNYIHVTKTIRDTVHVEGRTIYIAKSKTEVRQEQKTERKRIKQDAKTQRKQVKQDAKTERKKSFNWWIIVTLAIIGVVLFRIIQGKL